MIRFCLFVCLGFMAYQPLLVIYRQIHFYTNKQFYFKQFSLALVLSLIVKNISISSFFSLFKQLYFKQFSLVLV